MATTLKQSTYALLRKALVEADHVCVVLRDGQVSRICGPGYYRLNPFSETNGGLIYTGFRSSHQEIVIRSIDGLPLSLNIQIGFIFNPTLAHDKFEDKLALSTLKDHTVPNQIVREKTLQVSKALTGKREAHELLSGATWPRLEAQIRKQLREHLMKYGVRLAELPIEEHKEYPGNESVIIHGIKPVTEENDTYELIHFREFLVRYLSLPAEQIDSMLLLAWFFDQIPAGHMMQSYVYGGIPTMMPTPMLQTMHDLMERTGLPDETLSYRLSYNKTVNGKAQPAHNNSSHRRAR